MSKTHSPALDEHHGEIDRSKMKCQVVDVLKEGPAREFLNNVFFNFEKNYEIGDALAFSTFRNAYLENSEVVHQVACRLANVMDGSEEKSILQLSFLERIKQDWAGFRKESGQLEVAGNTRLNLLLTYGPEYPAHVAEATVPATTDAQTETA